MKRLGITIAHKNYYFKKINNSTKKALQIYKSYKYGIDSSTYYMGFKNNFDLNKIYSTFSNRKDVIAENWSYTCDSMNGYDPKFLSYNFNMFTLAFKADFEGKTYLFYATPNGEYYIELDSTFLLLAELD